VPGNQYFIRVWLKLFDFKMFSEADELSRHGSPVKILMTLNIAERVEVIPIVILVDSAQSEQGLSAVDRPKHAGQLAAIFDEVAAGAFDEAGADVIPKNL
jgi:hypothetical protein